MKNITHLVFCIFLLAACGKEPGIPVPVSIPETRNESTPNPEPIPSPEPTSTPSPTPTPTPTPSPTPISCTIVIGKAYCDTKLINHRVQFDLPNSTSSNFILTASENCVTVIGYHSGLATPYMQKTQCGTQIIWGINNFSGLEGWILSN